MIFKLSPIRYGAVSGAPSAQTFNGNLVTTRLDTGADLTTKLVLILRTDQSHALIVQLTAM
jgi:hypothetical protein